jgi:hypothetical protein
MWSRQYNETLDVSHACETFMRNQASPECLLLAGILSGLIAPILGGNGNRPDFVMSGL